MNVDKKVGPRRRIVLESRHKSGDQRRMNTPPTVIVGGIVFPWFSVPFCRCYVGEDQTSAIVTVYFMSTSNLN